MHRFILSFFLLLVFGLNATNVPLLHDRNAMDLPWWPSPRIPPHLVIYEHNPAIKAVTLGDAAVFLTDLDRTAHWDPHSLLAKIIGYAAKYTMILIPVGVVGASRTCPNNPAPEEEGLKHEVCTASLCGIFVPFGLMALFISKKTILHWQHQYADHYNAREARKIADELVGSRDYDVELDDKDLAYVAHTLIKKQSDLIGKLSIPQALAMTWMMPKELRHLPEYGFSDEAKNYLNRLITMTSLSSEMLVESLQSEENKKLFKAEPVFLQALIRALAQDVLNDFRLLAALVLVLKDLGLEANDDDEMIEFIRKIRQCVSIKDLLEHKSDVSDDLDCFYGEEIVDISDRED